MNKMKLQLPIFKWVYTFHALKITAYLLQSGPHLSKRERVLKNVNLQ